MEPTKKSGFVALMDVFKEDALIRMMVDMLQDVHDCCDDAKKDATTLESALRHFLQRIDKDLPSAFWPSDFA